MHYQPIVRSGGDLLAVEALARWHHPKRGVVAPAAFIPAAERDRRTIWELTQHTLSEAIQDVQSLPGEDLAVSVNLSAATLRHPDLHGTLAALLESTGFPADRLMLEITESGIAGSDEAVVDVVAAIRRLGVKVAIDDFGVGQSSLARFGQVPIDVLKLDQSLIRGHRDPRTEAILRAIVEVGRALDVTVVAEGVEDEGACKWLTELNCDAHQGFFFARPMPLEELEPWVEAALVRAEA